MGGCYNEEIKLIICRVCKIEKEESCFMLRRDTGRYRTDCDDCRRARARISRKNKYSSNPELRVVERMRLVELRANFTQEIIDANNARDLARYHEKVAQEKELFKKIHGVSKESVKSKAMYNKFIRDAMFVHGDKFGYDRVEYQDNLTKVEIHCRACDIYFHQTPKDHRAGKGCQYCTPNGYRKSKEGSLYVLTCDNITKVGITNRNVSKRVTELNRSFGRTFKELFSVKGCGDKIAKLEKTVLKFLVAKHKQPLEVFQGSTECFYDVNLPELINIIEREYGFRFNSERRQD